MTKLKRHIEELNKRRPPLLAVNAVIQKGDEVLLIQRAKEPARGSWVVPGGHVDYNEDLEEAVKREVKEETGLDIRIVGIISTESDKKGLDPRGYHVMVNYLTAPIGGKLRKTKETLDIKWFKLGSLPNNLGLGVEKYFQEAITREQQISELVKYVPPMPMVNQVIYKGNKILIGKRGKAPHFTEWGLPGGHFSYKEKIEVASARKAKEETGLDVEVEQVIHTSSDFGVDPRSVNVAITHLCRYKAGKFTPTEDVKEIMWLDVRKPMPKDVEIIGAFTKPVEKARKILLKRK